MIDASAPAQVAQGAEGEAGGEEAAAAAPAPAAAAGAGAAARSEEQPPLARRQEPVRQRPVRHEPSGPALDEWGYVGIGVMALGIAGVGAGIGMLIKANQYAQGIVDDACPAGAHCPMKNGMPDPYYFGFAPDGGPTDLDFQNQGHLLNTAGIATAVAGGVLVAGGITLTIIDAVAIAPAHWKRKQQHKERPPTETGPAPFIPQSSIQDFRLAPVVGPTFAGLSAGFSF
jgi:hypothetical protein